MSEPTFVQETLDWCNALRAEDGKESLKRLPKGRRGDSWSCPCGAATGWIVGSNHASSDGRRCLLPYAVQIFVLAFDSGDLPQYEVK